MNFKLILLFAAVLCFGQGYAWSFGASFGGGFGLKDLAQNVKNKVGEVGSSITDKVKGSYNDVQNSITNAGSKLKDQLDAARQSTEDARDAVQNKLNQARNEMEGMASKLQGEISSFTDDVLDKMDPKRIIDEATSMSKKIDVVVDDVKSQVETAVSSAKNVAQNRINSWDVVVQQAAARAKELGVDIKDCSADRVQELGKSVLQNAVSCVTDKFEEARALVDDFISIGTEGHDIVNGMKAAHETCSQKTSIDVVVCAGQEMMPLFKRIIALSSDTVSASTQAVTLVQTLQTSLTTCMASVAAVETIKLPELTIDITKCIAAKIQDKGEAAAAA